jgi:bifunctional DNase/RNase
VTGPAGGQGWRLVTVAGVSLELPGVHPEVVLRECEAPWRELRIPVGFAEGTAIAYALRSLPTPRPLTHALMAELLERHAVDVAALRICGRQEGTFLGELDTSGPRGHHTVACRPSDGLALVLRRRPPTPILVVEELLGPVPGAEHGEEGAAPGAERGAAAPPGA